MKQAITKGLHVERALAGIHCGNALSRIHNFDGFMRLPSWKNDVFVYVAYPLPDAECTAPQLQVVSRFGEVAWIPNMIELLDNKWEYWVIKGRVEE